MASELVWTMVASFGMDWAFFLFFLSFLFVCPFLEYMLASSLQILLILFSLVSVCHGLQ